jgi:hypothetical protein
LISTTVKLPPVFQALSGDSTLFRDPTLTNGNDCTQVPGGQEITYNYLQLMPLLEN